MKISIPVNMESTSSAREYEGSEEFMEAQNAVYTDLKNVTTTVSSPAWKGWMKDTDSNMGAKAVAANTKVIKLAKELYKALEKLDDELTSE